MRPTYPVTEEPFGPSRHYPLARFTLPSSFGTLSVLLRKSDLVPSASEGARQIELGTIAVNGAIAKEDRFLPAGTHLISRSIGMDLYVAEVTLVL